MDRDVILHHMTSYDLQVGSYKEDYLAPFNEQIMDEGHIRDVKTVSGSIPNISFLIFPFRGSSI